MARDSVCQGTTTITVFDQNRNVVGGAKIVRRGSSVRYEYWGNVEAKKEPRKPDVGRMKRRRRRLRKLDTRRSDS